MFHLRLWRALSEFASAHCNARVYMLTFMLEKNRRTSERGRDKPPSGTEEGKS